MMRLFKTGPHARRLPLSYPALAPLFSDRIAQVGAPQDADLYIFAHALDIEDAPAALVEDWRRRRRPVVLLSEEPFWDTIWARQPLARHRVLDTRFGPLPVVQLNHHTSAIFRFDRIPYYLLTNHRFANAYAARFARNARISPRDWRTRFAARRTDLVFMFERRPEPHHAVRWPEGEIIGLCSWRTELAEACTSGRVERLGHSWQDRGGPRQSLANWHLDKLALLDGHTRLLAAFENTHQPGYITEKLFDAFACGALPLYFAAPSHRIHEFGLPGPSWLNLHDLDAAAAAGAVEGFRWTAETFDAYAEAQQTLAQRFGDPGAWVRERDRLQATVLQELAEILDGA